MESPFFNLHEVRNTSGLLGYHVYRPKKGKNLHMFAKRGVTKRPLT